MLKQPCEVYGFHEGADETITDGRFVTFLYIFFAR